MVWAQINIQKNIKTKNDLSRFLVFKTKKNKSLKTIFSNPEQNWWYGSEVSERDTWRFQEVLLLRYVMSTAERNFQDEYLNIL